MGRIDHQTLSALTEEARAEFRTGSAFLSSRSERDPSGTIVLKDVTSVRLSPCSGSHFMPVNFRITSWPIIRARHSRSSSWRVAAPRNPAGHSLPAPSRRSPRPCRPAGPGPLPDLKDIKKELEDIKKDVTPPVIIKPDVSPAPAAEPRKTG